MCFDGDLRDNKHSLVRTPSIPVAKSSSSLEQVPLETSLDLGLRRFLASCFIGKGKRLSEPGNETLT